MAAAGYESPPHYISIYELKHPHAMKPLENLRNEEELTYRRTFENRLRHSADDQAAVQL